jgi:hypothetical protein
MAPLDYQSPRDATPERLKQLRLRWFGASRADVWRALADEINARYEKGGLWRGDRVVADSGPWQLVLDTFTVSTGETAATYTRMRAPYVNADGFRFTIFRKHFFTGLAKFFGMQDVEVGYPAFDEAFVIKGNSESKLRQLFANVRLRELLAAQPSVYFTVKDDEGTFRKTFPNGVDELYFQVGGVVKDIDRLKRMYELFAETLEELCRMGSAYAQEPGVSI